MAVDELRGAVKITHIITKLDVGGAQETAIRACIGLKDRGHEVVLVAGPERGSNGDLRPSAHRARLPVVTVPSLVRAIRPARDLRALVALVRLLRRLRPDVVQTHSSKAGILGRAAARIARVPVVVHTVHGWSFRDDQRREVRRLFAWLERRLAAGTDILVVVTGADIDIGLAQRVGDRRRYRLVRSGIALADWRPREGARESARARLGVGEASFVVGSVMRLAWPKDPTTLVRAVGRLGGGSALVIVGEGDLRSDVESTAASLDPRPTVILAGVRDDVPAVVHAFDVAVLSSTSEGLPRAVIEAMAAGVPVVSTDVGGVREVIADGKTGLVVPPGNERAMADALQRLRDEPAFARQLAAEALLQVESFGVEAMVDRLEAIYRECLQTRRRSRHE